jgi:hypothetical protein
MFETLLEKAWGQPRLNWLRYPIRDLWVYFSNYSAISHGKPVFSADDLDLTFQGHQRSNWLSSDSRHIISYTCVIVTIALSRTENLFLSRWPWSGLLRSPNVKMIIYHLICAISLFLYMFYRNYSAISHGKPVFQQMALIWAFKVTIGQTDYTIWFAPYHFLYVFYSNYSAVSAISHGKPVSQQMTLIWPSKVTKGQTDYTNRFAPYHFLYVFYSNYSAISHGKPVFQ